MKILITSIGTRGDMEPFLAIAEILKGYGHDVTCLFPDQFKNLVDDTGVAFEGLGPEFYEMLESDIGQFAMGGGGNKFKKIISYIKLGFKQKGINKKLVQRQFEVVQKLQPDRIVHNGKAMYPVLWEIENPGNTTYVSPVPYLHYVKGHTHTAFHSNFGEFFNKLTYKLADFGVLKAIQTTAKQLKLKYTKQQIKTAYLKHQIVYTVSPHLFQRPDYWPSNMQVLGYHERNKTTNWTPSNELLTFINTKRPVVLFTFGSMSNPEPEKKTQIVLEAFEKLDVTVIINSPANGLIEPKEYDRKKFFFTKNIPYDWAFPKMHAVVHHGGSGSTHMSLKYACPTLIIPHIIDQFNWNNLVAEQNFGPKGISISKLNTKDLHLLLKDLITNPLYNENTEKISAKIQAEDFTADLHRILTE
ncbi:UDP:flavonoid glycosyltransferase YjiC, YdhE family [Lishizhenia tianjinensis]|uniref:UDP:flavonoid glycosyltransferase YjiC, YdhE family n=1 Tax=Lishizhenia tianjinensis TaxID=477690 RepID=A0A1I6Z212_9FLAO|nr:glycosyltransferase [Lishizhenia tianjinensis]SFT56757.1 UDP:flavonoid glycosyltransferase YjiC, YdhE family [Lishizhenia tianjinensis]